MAPTGPVSIRNVSLGFTCSSPNDLFLAFPKSNTMSVAPYCFIISIKIMNGTNGTYLLSITFTGSMALSKPSPGSSSKMLEMQWLQRNDILMNLRGLQIKHPLYYFPRSCLLACSSCFSRVRLYATLWTIACQAPLSIGLSRLGYRSGLHCLPPGDLPSPETEPASLTSPALAGGFLYHQNTQEATILPVRLYTVSCLTKNHPPQLKY